VDEHESRKEKAMKLSASHPSIVALAAACPAIPERMLEVVADERTGSEAGARFAVIVASITSPLAILGFEAEQGSTIDVLHLDADGEPTLTGIHIGFTGDEVGSASIPLNRDGDDEFVLTSYQFCEPPVADVLAALSAARA
jgi:hypothetical protein